MYVHLLSAVVRLWEGSVAEGEHHAEQNLVIHSSHLGGKMAIVDR